MKMISYAVIILMLVLSKQIGLIQPAMAAGTVTASTIESDRQRIGTINSIDLQHGLIVIDDAEFHMSDKMIVHGRNSGTKLSLSKGMKVKFSYVPVKDRYAINEIWLNQ